MSHVVDHVDETQLHAYLDRELEFADPEVRKAVGRHIADCSRCANLLKEVRLVHQQADRLLDAVKPPSRPAPSFHEIVERAQRRSTELPIPNEVDPAAESSRFRRKIETESDDPFTLDAIDDLPKDEDRRPEDDVDTDWSDSEESSDSSIEGVSARAAEEPFVLDAIDDLPKEDDTPPENEVRSVWPDPKEASDPIIESVDAEAAAAAEVADDNRRDETASDPERTPQEEPVGPEPERPLEITLSGQIGHDLEWVGSDPGETPEADTYDAPPVDVFATDPALSRPATAADEPIDSVDLVSDQSATVETPSMEEGDQRRSPEEELVAAEHEIVFVESPNSSSSEAVQSLPSTSESPRSSGATRVGRTRRRMAPFLARAAVILIAVGFGGWFARPILMERLAAPTDDFPPAEQLASRDAAEPARQALPESSPAVDRAANVQSSESRAVASAAGGEGEREEITVPSPATPAPQEQVERSVSGIVRDAATGQAVARAQVTVAGTGQGTLTDDSGRYRLSNIPAGSLEVGVRQLGYEAVSKSLSVGANRDATADFDLRSSRVALDEVVAAQAPQQGVARARAERADPDLADAPGIEITRAAAEIRLGGPIVAVDGLRIVRIATGEGNSDVLVQQRHENGALVNVTIRSPGAIGPRPTLHDVQVVGEEADGLVNGSAHYGDYELGVSARVSPVELESLLRRISIPPEPN